MKNIENYVCTFEQAKKLKELGVEQFNTPLFYYRHILLEATDYYCTMRQIVNNKTLHLNTVDNAYLNDFCDSRCSEYPKLEKLKFKDCQGNDLWKDESPSGLYDHCRGSINDTYSHDTGKWSLKYYQAFTSQELQELIEEVEGYEDVYFFSYLESEAQWRAEFLIYLLETKK